MELQVIEVSDERARIENAEERRSLEQGHQSLDHFNRR